MPGRLISAKCFLGAHSHANEITSVEQAGIKFRILCNCRSTCTCKPEFITYYEKDRSSASTLDIKICRCSNKCVCDPMERGIEIDALTFGYIEEYRKTNPPDMTLAEWLTAMDRSAPL